MNNANYLGKAKSFELKGIPSEAFDFYCQAIDSNESLEFDDYINFSVLAFLFQDYGYASSNEISTEQVDLAWSYMHKSLELCEVKYGESPIINFWKKYYAMILLGELISENDLLGFINSGVQDAVFCMSSNLKTTEDIESPKANFSTPKTFKERYILSMAL